MATLPFALAEYSPLADYPQWVFQGYLLNRLLFDPTALDAALIQDLYSLVSGPVPNSASSWSMAVLNLWLPAKLAGRLFMALCVLLFAWGFAYLVRARGGAPTAVEWLGFPFAFGYFTYNGTVSYLASLALLLFALGVLFRSYHGGVRRSCLAIAVLMLLSPVLFLAHLIGWTCYALAVAVCALFAIRERPLVSAAQVGTLTVPAVLLLFYIRDGSAGDPPTVYQSIPNKVASLVQPLLLVMRTDPFAFAPVTGLQAALAVLLLVLLLDSLAAPPWRQASVPALTSAAAMGLVAALMPFSYFGGLVRPDERFTLPAFLTLLAAFDWHPLSARRSMLPAIFVAVVLAFHTVEYVAVSRSLATVDAALNASVPSGSHLLSLDVHEPPLRSACPSSPALPSLGVPALRWFALYHALENGGFRANVFKTGLLRPTSGPTDLLDLRMLEVDPGERLGLVETVSRLTPAYDHAVVFGCDRQVDAALPALLAARYEVVDRGDGFAILRWRAGGR